MSADVSLQFIVGGGWSLAFDYHVVGGPDDGRRVSLVPLRSGALLSPTAEMADGGRWASTNRPGFASPDPWGRDGQPPLADVTLHACYAELVKMSEFYPPATPAQAVRLGICQRNADPRFTLETLPLPALLPTPAPR